MYTNVLMRCNIENGIKVALNSGDKNQFETENTDYFYCLYRFIWQRQRYKLHRMAVPESNRKSNKGVEPNVGKRGCVN